ncbi:uncharacterized protein LOC129945078 [Eupeodes corollae]|uniref:uncharacterized protein LOC129945078 n=1 Tax=Eupeodes corollae TaxID=290404 RepID=UPI00249252D1|nr:uncharacterized protein LOC129945078 [Eupeodes corollae]
MYRQVVVHPEDAHFQRILWRQNEGEPVKEYNLQTVTYGTTCAPFLAIRTLKQLAIDEQGRHPVGAANLLNNFYVDDFMGGSDTIEEALGVKTDLCNLLARGGIDLRKWASNCSEFLQHIPEDSLEMSALSLSEDMAVKTLGLYWNPSGDFFFFRVTLEEQKIATKRVVLSEISRIFDPFGWVSPSIIMAKVLIQDLYIAGVSWDDQLPPSLMQKWLTIRKNLGCLENISIPRWIRTEKEGCRIQFHGFSDASERAYAACIYISIHSKGKCFVSLLASKTKVAPVNRISIPKLELCGAHLLAKLIASVKKGMGLGDVECYAWTDSQVVLAWLSQHPCKWTTFVGNRTSEILELVPKSQWRHVSSKLNPADCASRGLQPNLLPSFDLWWQGPAFLRDMEAIQNKFIFKNTETDLEKRNITLSLATTEAPPENEILLRFSSLTRLKRIMAWCRRFIHNAKLKGEDEGKREFGPLSTNELEAELCFWIRETQNAAFSMELNRLKLSKPIRIDSNLKSLDPFIGNDDLLRVGGRIQKGQFGFQQKHPPILPKESHLTTLILAFYHHKYLHGGPHLMLGVIRQNYWILHLKGKVSKYIRGCVKCQRYAARPLEQQMGNLPKVRLEMCKPFTNTGVDYAGPLTIQTYKGRGAKHQKCYVALFICLSTRAIHLELVSDLTSDAAIAALKRFLSMRGSVKRILSDNGSNFIGASRELKAIYKLFNSNENIHKYVAEEEISCEFIPPHAPHFGGGPTMTLPEQNLCDAKINTLSRWQYTQRLQQEFWRRWQREYLHQLQQRTKWTLKKRNMELNDLVLVLDNNLPPSKWLMGRVINLFPGADGLIRVVEIRTKSGVMRRDITKLALLLPNDD